MKTMRTACAIATGLLLFGWVGCSVEKDYDLLSFFFDGVPEPGSLGSGGGLLRGGSNTLFTHEPYATESCLECHPNPSQMQLSRNDSTLCMKCHEGVLEQYAFMHGAVLGNACLWCHDPHISVNASLLREPSPAICAQCHQQGALNAPNSDHASADTDCLSCHKGHGGQDAYFLRDPEVSDNQDLDSNADTEHVNEDAEPGTPSADGL